MRCSGLTVGANNLLAAINPEALLPPASYAEVPLVGFHRLCSLCLHNRAEMEASGRLALELRHSAPPALDVLLELRLLALLPCSYARGLSLLYSGSLG